MDYEKKMKRAENLFWFFIIVAFVSWIFTVNLVLHVYDTVNKPPSSKPHHWPTQTKIQYKQTIIINEPVPNGN